LFHFSSASRISGNWQAHKNQLITGGVGIGNGPLLERGKESTAQPETGIKIVMKTHKNLKILRPCVYIFFAGKCSGRHHLCVDIKLKGPLAIKILKMEICAMPRGIRVAEKKKKA